MIEELQIARIQQRTEQTPRVVSVADAVRSLTDAEYFRWARIEADKHFSTLIGKRFPALVTERRRNPPDN